MKFTVERDFLLKSLHKLSNLSISKPTLPILTNLLLQVVDDALFLTSTDLEVEITARLVLTTPYHVGETTVPARKFFDICRRLRGGAEITVQLVKKHVLIYSDRSKFSLSTLPTSDFPNFGHWKSEIEFTLSKKTIKNLIEATQFSMARQDVRYYLNGMLFEIKGDKLCIVTTDGHRLAIGSMLINVVVSNCSVIIPRKGILKLVRVLNCEGTLLHVQISNNNIRFCTENCTFTSKTIDGRFPDYNCVFPKNVDKILEVECNMLKQALSRAIILSNETFHSVHLYIKDKQLKIISNNLQQEEAEEYLDVSYTGPEMEISFNANYILDILNVLKCKNVRILLTDSTSSVQIEDTESQDISYILMPIKI